MPNMQNTDHASRAELTDLVIKTSRRMRTLFNARVSERGLTYPRARALAELARHPLPTQTELACQLQLESATVVRLLDGMERLDLIERLPSPGDRRAKIVRLTPAGRKAAAAVSAASDDIRDVVLADIDDREIVAALAVMRRMARAIQAVSHPGASDDDE